jgi:adenosylcobinamide-GDP ribazoletransferase
MRAAVALLTVLGRATEPTPRAWRWFPVVGAATGALVGGAWWLASEAFPPLPAAVLTVLAGLVVTGLLHFDGLADAADGLLCHASPPERLRIMRTPDVGAFGAVAVAVVLLLQVSALASQAVSIVLVAAVWGASRTTVTGAPVWLPYARDDGIAAPMLGSDISPWPLAALIPIAVLAAAVDGLRGGAAVAATVLATAGILGLARRRVGGFTGDVLGAAIVVGETVGLVVGAARW